MLDKTLNIKVHYTSKRPIRFKVRASTFSKTYYEYDFSSEPQGIVDMTADFPLNDDVNIVLSCNDPEIYHYPIEVNYIEFDNFFKLKSLAHSGVNFYDQQFLDHAKLNNILIEEQTDNNCLFFTGSLTYTVFSPISRMLFGSPIFS